MPRTAPIWLLLTLAACGSSTQVPPVGDVKGPPPDEVAIPVTETPRPLPVQPTEPRYAASHLLVAWQGAVKAPATVTRGEEEARALAESLRERAVAGEDFASLARQHSDGPSAPRGGSLGVYATGTMVPEFESAVASVSVGEIAPVVRTPFGFHVVRRDAIREARVRHVLIAYMGADRAATARTKEEARAEAERVLGRLEAGEPLAILAQELSDDPSRLVGGDIGLVAPGQMVPAFEDAVFALAKGEHSGVVETPYGFHVIERVE